jgi:hypothetical protein
MALTGDILRVNDQPVLDYREGYFYWFLGNSGDTTSYFTMNASYNKGYYVKIGKLVYIFGQGGATKNTAYNGDSVYLQLPWQIDYSDGEPDRTQGNIWFDSPTIATDDGEHAVKGLLQATNKYASISHKGSGSSMRVEDWDSGNMYFQVHMTYWHNELISQNSPTVV